MSVFLTLVLIYHASGHCHLSLVFFWPIDMRNMSNFLGSFISYNLSPGNDSYRLKFIIDNLSLLQKIKCILALRFIVIYFSLTMKNCLSILICGSSTYSQTKSDSVISPSCVEFPVYMDKIFCNFNCNYRVTWKLKYIKRRSYSFKNTQIIVKYWYTKGISFWSFLFINLNSVLSISY